MADLLERTEETQKTDRTQKTQKMQGEAQTERYPFVHLHNHSDYSLLDGAVKVEWYGERVAELGMKHIALTDHGNLFGAIHFQNTCRKRA